MTLRLTLVMVVATGCAAGLQTVPNEEMQVVPAVEQARIDSTHATEVARVDAEQRSAQAGLASARRELAAFHRHAQPAAVVAAPGDEWATAMRSQDTARRTALTEVDAATEAWLHARVDYHQQVLDHATAERATLHCSRELTRAKAVDHHLLGTDTYDTAPYRAQLASVQQRWYAAEVRRGELQVALQRASIRLATAKDAYAAVLMHGPTAPTSSDPTTFIAWNPAAERTRNHRLHLVRAAANTGPRFLTPPARVARR
jgi:hypothetical protein